MEAQQSPTVSTHPHIDRTLAELDAQKQTWATLPIAEKIQLLHDSRTNLGKHAQEWIDLSVQGKKLDPDSPWVGEEWVSGPWAVAGWLNGMMATLEALGKGENPPIKKIYTRPNGQVIANVFPNDMYDEILLNGTSAEVWMQPEVTLDNFWEQTAVFYRNPTPTGKVALVLGAGNINAIAPLDTLYKLYADGEVVILKMNPVNDYLGPVLEKVFAPFVERGFLRFAYGGAEVGAYLTDHPLVQTLHITGSAKTHDIIMFGSGTEGASRKATNSPCLDKPMTSELGGVGPVIVVPGRWSKADIDFQAQNIATMKLHNAGCNCVAAQVIITSDGWAQRDALIDGIQQAFQQLPPRANYYPGADEREQRAAMHGERVEAVNGRIFITHLDPNSPDDYCFNSEFFSQALAHTNLESTDPLKFLHHAIQFANNQLDGTLGATILIHPKTLAQMGKQFDIALENLRYGAIGVNVWNAGAFLLAHAAWGAYPGHTLDDIQSGIGTVHNAFLLDKPQKTIVRGPFRPMHRAWLNGRFHLMPKPIWFVNNKTAATTAKRVAQFAIDPSWDKLPAIVASATLG